MTSPYNTPFCARCKEDFPVSDNPKGPWQLGLLYPLKKLGKRLIEKCGLRDWLGHDAGNYLCGNCYFDVTDDS